MEKECGICHGHCTDPEVLPCGHCYCKQCIRGLALRAGIVKPFPCPECGTDTILPKAFFVECMKKREFLADESVVNGRPLDQCKRHHSQKNLKAYCYKCKHLVCGRCVGIGSDCRDHKFQYLDRDGAVPEEKRKFREQLEPLKRGIEEGFQSLEKLQATKFEMEDQGYYVANSIESSFEELFKVMLNHKQELIGEATSQVMYKLKRISDQEKSLFTTIASMQRAVDYAERCVDNMPVDHLKLNVDYLPEKAFMNMHSKIQDRIDSEKGNVEVVKNVEPVEEVDIGVELIRAKDLKLFCQTNSKISPLPVDATKCLVTGEGVQSAEVNTMSEFRVIANKLSNGKPTRKTCVVKSYLKSLITTDPNIECQVDPIEGAPGEYRIQYTPTVQGRHELMVTVNGQEVAGSPFPVFVSIHPTQLGKPVHVITGVKSPGHLALTPAGNIIVSDSNTITMLDRTGKKLMKSEYGFRDLIGVAVDSTDGCVYVTDNSRIIKLSPDLKLKQVFDSNSSFGYSGVSVVGDEVMVCIRDSISVYTKELEYVRRIGEGMLKLTNIKEVCSDVHGNVYVCDHRPSSVKVFSNGGEFLRSLKCDGDGVKILNGPHGVCVSGQYVYVTNYKGHSVSVFTTDGDYVTTFGQRGSSHGDLLSPCDVCIDKDGFVYVSESHRIQIF